MFPTKRAVLGVSLWRHVDLRRVLSVQTRTLHFTGLTVGKIGIGILRVKGPKE